MGWPRHGHRRVAGAGRRWVSVLALCLVLCGTNLVAPVAHAAPTVDPGGFVSLAPARLLDTRSTGGSIAANSTRPLKVAGVGGVPSAGVSAVVLNVTVTETTNGGYLTVFPTGAARPVVSNLNWSTGLTIPNAVTVKVGDAGWIDIFQSGPGTAQVIVDVSGYYVDGTIADPGAFTALTPSRILDTRTNGGSLASSETRDLQVTGQPGGPSGNVGAVVLNVTVTETTNSGYLAVFPSGSARPTVSNLNWNAGVTIPNQVIAMVGNGWKVSLFQSGPGTAQVIVDVAGFFLGGTATQLGMYYALTPSRVLDTRDKANPLLGGEDRSMVIAGSHGIPATGAGAVVLNTTVTQTGAPGFLTVHPGFSAAPLASNLNWGGAGATIPNLVTVQLGRGGSVGFRNGSGQSTQVIADVAGYYVGVTPAAPKVTALASGGYHTCAISEGLVYCWGQNRYGQLGNGTTIDSTTPVLVAGGLTNVTAIVAGESHTCALTNGAVYCWGWNDSGQVGDGSQTTRSAPTRVTGLNGFSLTAIAAGKQHTCAAAGTSVWCWGFDQYGQLGDGGTASRLAPWKLATLPGNVSGLAAGLGHSCALIVDGTVRCWGWNGNGQLGDGTTTDRSAPTRANLTSATAVTAGWDHTCAMTSASGVVCWGNNDFGQLGDGTAGTPRLAPASVPGLTGVTSLSAGDSHTCVVAGASASCWGRDLDGQLGDGGGGDQLLPTLVLGVDNVSTVAAGRASTCGTTTGGGVMCWGSNAYGQLGNGTTTDSALPVPVVGLG